MHTNQKYSKNDLTQPQLGENKGTHPLNKIKIIDRDSFGESSNNESLFQWEHIILLVCSLPLTILKRD